MATVARNVKEGDLVYPVGVPQQVFRVKTVKVHGVYYVLTGIDVKGRNVVYRGCFNCFTALYKDHAKKAEKYGNIIDILSAL